MVAGLTTASITIRNKSADICRGFNCKKEWGRAWRANHLSNWGTSRGMAMGWLELVHVYLGDSQSLPVSNCTVESYNNCNLLRGFLPGTVISSV